MTHQGRIAKSVQGILSQQEMLKVNWRRDSPDEVWIGTYELSILLLQLNSNTIII